MRTCQLQFAGGFFISDTEKVNVIWSRLYRLLSYIMRSNPIMSNRFKNTHVFVAFYRRLHAKSYAFFERVQGHTVAQGRPADEYATVDIGDRLIHSAGTGGLSIFKSMGDRISSLGNQRASYRVRN